jgi:hypothetical protein
MMKKSLISIILTLGLSGCIHIPSIPPFPEAPKILLEPVEPLTMINKENIELTDVIENAAENAAKYYKLREKYLAWQEWYAEQKKLQEQVLK